MKLVKEKLTKNPNIKEGLKISGHQYDHIKTPIGTIYAGSDGILGPHEKLIPWDMVKSLLDKYAK